MAVLLLSLGCVCSLTCDAAGRPSSHTLFQALSLSIGVFWLEMLNAHPTFPGSVDIGDERRV